MTKEQKRDIYFALKYALSEVKHAATVLWLKGGNEYKEKAPKLEEWGEEMKGWLEEVKP